MSVARCQREVSAREFREWQEYYWYEPFGDAWRQTASICSRLYDIWGLIYTWLSGKEATELDLEDFMPRREPGADEALDEAKVGKIMGFFYGIGVHLNAQAKK